MPAEYSNRLPAALREKLVAPRSVSLERLVAAVVAFIGETFANNRPLGWEETGLNPSKAKVGRALAQEVAVLVGAVEVTEVLKD